MQKRVDPLSVKVEKLKTFLTQPFKWNIAVLKK